MFCKDAGTEPPGCNSHRKLPLQVAHMRELLQKAAARCKLARSAKGAGKGQAIQIVMCHCFRVECRSLASAKEHVPIDPCQGVKLTVEKLERQTCGH